jgi:carboxypeptidase family protein
MKTNLTNFALSVCLCLLVNSDTSVFGQTLSSGTVNGTVVDQSGAVVPGSTVELRNDISRYQQSTTTDAAGMFRFSNVPFNNYRVTAALSGFNTTTQDISIRSAVPQDVKLTMAVGNVTEAVTVQAAGAIENIPTAHSDADRSFLATLPSTMAGSGLSELVTMLAPGVVNDSNGFFHPLGDHAETSFVIDGQPLNDQISKVFSTQLPTNALQNLELNTGFPPAEYGEKTSLIINAVTRSGLGSKPTGEVVFSAGSFSSTGVEANVGAGTPKFGFFTAVNASRSDRFLDTPEFDPNLGHDHGTNGSVFVRLDGQPQAGSAVHLNAFIARNSFQIPNSLDQLTQDQRQKVVSYNIAPGYQRAVSDHALLTVNGWVRHDRVNYSPSPDMFNDTPATVSQNRGLTSAGVKGDVTYTGGVNSVHTLKVGAQFTQTRLDETFGLGITDPTFNPVCLTSAGDAVTTSSLIDSEGCARFGYQPNPNLQPGLVPLDLTRGGSRFTFHDTGNINEVAVYAQDTINWGRLTLSPGLRITRYDGLSQATGVQPRFGVAFLAAKNTVLRASYARTLETPHNENLLLSSATGVGGVTDVFGAVQQQPLQPGRRNQFNVGFQQTVGRLVQFDVDYWVKHTTNAAEFDVILNTPITFPIMWAKDKLDGFGFRISTLNLKGLRLNTTMGTGRLRYFGPEVGGLIFNAPLANVFRTDSDDKFYQTTTIDYHMKSGPWVGLTWRYDNGQVAGAGADLGEMLGLTAAQQSAAGFFCGSDVATPSHPITACSAAWPNYGATRIQMPAPGTADRDNNPPRVAPRNLLDLAVGTDNLLMTSGRNRVKLQFAIVNVANKEALYNFLSTFGGTHFVQPRTYQVKLGFLF